MVFEISDTSQAEPLFAGWQETLLYSCLQGIMGKIYATEAETPRAAFAHVGCFGFYAGEPDRELVRFKPEGFAILTPQNEAWAVLIEETYPEAKKVTRYAIRKDTAFDAEQLRKNVLQLPDGYVLRPIDADLYDQCLENPLTADFVSSFSGKQHFLEYGRGMVVVKNGEIVAGASSYSRYREGIEIEVDTVPDERRRHLALAACSALILQCLEEGLYPSWDAQNMASVRLAEKLGYVLDHEYTAYEVAPDRGNA